MKQEELCRKLTEMIAETKAQKLSWRLEERSEGKECMLGAYLVFVVKII